MAKINLDYYKNEDNNCYYILNELKEEAVELLKDPNNDDKVREQFGEIYYYLLSENIKDLLNWYDFKENSDILEVSSGLGTNTKMLCKKAKTVTTINFSKTNAEITAERLKDCDNLEIIAGNLKDIELDKKFDYIVLIDVLEFFNLSSPNPVQFIRYFKDHLKEDGVIICAVSNKYGFSEFSGGVSHITGRAFDNINNYPKVKHLNVFTKRQLNQIFRMSGFSNVDFYYPIPNHYTNRVILSDRSLSDAFIGNKIPSKFRSYYVNPNNLINERMLVADFMQTDFTFFANSYLVFLSNGNSPKSYYAQVNHNILTTLDDDCCKKSALSDKAQAILNNMFEFYKAETERIKENNIENIAYAKCKVEDDSLILDKAKGEPMNKLALRVIFDHSALLTLLTEYKSLIYKLYPKHIYQDFKVNDEVTLKNVACVENANIDLNMANIYKDGENYTIIDYDKFSNLIPLNYIVAQGVFVLAIDSQFSFDDVEYLKLLGLSEREIAIYQAIYAQNINK